MKEGLIEAFVSTVTLAVELTEAFDYSVSVSGGCSSKCLSIQLLSYIGRELFVAFIYLSIVTTETACTMSVFQCVKWSICTYV
jgi:hypothetical protein